MKLYISTKSMTFDEDNIEHEIILSVRSNEFLGYDILIELPDNDEFIQNTLKIEYKKDKDDKETEEIEHKQFIVREQNTWNSFPLFEYKNGKIISFDWGNYSYFTSTNRRNMLTMKINELYNPPAEAKVIRRTIKLILDKLDMECPEFEKYNQKVYNIISKFPKKKKRINK